MSSGEDIANEGCYYGEEKKDNSDVSSFFIYIGAIVEASADVKIDADEEKRCAVGMEVADYSAVVDVSADVGDG